MRRIRSITLVLCLFCTLALHAAPGLTGEVRATTPREVLFSGITPGGTLVVFGMSVSHERGAPKRSRVAELVADADGDGSFALIYGSHSVSQSMLSPSVLARAHVLFAKGSQ